MNKSKVNIVIRKVSLTKCFSLLKKFSSKSSRTGRNISRDSYCIRGVFFYDSLKLKFIFGLLLYARVCSKYIYARLLINVSLNYSIPVGSVEKRRERKQFSD